MVRVLHERVIIVLTQIWSKSLCNRSFRFMPAGWKRLQKHKSTKEQTENNKHFFFLSFILLICLSFVCPTSWLLLWSEVFDEFYEPLSKHEMWAQPHHHSVSMARKKHFRNQVISWALRRKQNREKCEFLHFFRSSMKFDQSHPLRKCHTKPEASSIVAIYK